MECQARWYAVAALIALAWMTPAVGLAQQVGSYVVVLEDAKIISGTEAVEDVSRGMALKVRGARPGGWLWVTHHQNGWIEGKHVIPLQSALDYLAAEIAQQPLYAPLHNDRATVLFEIGDYAGAVRNYTAALRLMPGSFPLLANRAVAYFELGEFGLAVEDLNEVVQQRPDDAQSYVDRGWAKYHAELFADAVADYEQALKLDPNVLQASINLAWLRATCPDEQFRDGAAALKLAEQVCEATSNKDPFALGALAAAQAELGNYAEAVAVQKQALELASYMRKKPYRERLAFYEAGAPYRLGADVPAAKLKTGPTPTGPTPTGQAPTVTSPTTEKPAAKQATPTPQPSDADPQPEEQPAPEVDTKPKSVLTPSKKPRVEKPVETPEANLPSENQTAAQE